MIRIDRLDHLVLTVADIAITCDFYSRILGMSVETFAEGRKAVKFGGQKINLHQAGNEFDPRQGNPHPAPATSVSSPRHRLPMSSLI
ncbi:glyoxalase/bleomycin resistance protein/dioxygenase superfamily protein [Rhizobium laguerreae]|uniref:Glyoxalase/bleomycin resistance protein/dioxygenase superfamily protein n=1 Tax=Rhizobium laguerreae TaxID=1076926 RepID=A0AAX2QMS8_9HYPH|nr:glyoxalase/bleomycin resistance protein/dioxygenase superfamily protein [Rhizobium laguerreae]